jgi:hypothetical protein
MAERRLQPLAESCDFGGLKGLCGSGGATGARGLSSVDLCSKLSGLQRLLGVVIIASSTPPELRERSEDRGRKREDDQRPRQQRRGADREDRQRQTGDAVALERSGRRSGPFRRWVGP